MRTPKPQACTSECVSHQLNLDFGVRRSETEAWHRDLLLTQAVRTWKSSIVASQQRFFASAAFPVSGPGLSLERARASAHKRAHVGKASLLGALPSLWSSILKGQGATAASSPKHSDYCQTSVREATSLKRTQASAGACTREKVHHQLNSDSAVTRDKSCRLKRV